MIELARWLAFLSAGTALSSPSGDSTSSVRYALVIGNDQAGSAPLPDLDHAEEDARKLRDLLVTHGNFSSDPDRTVLLVGRRRGEILQAARRLGERHRSDRRALGEVPTLFALFFTGHGLGGQLLTADLPLTGEDLAHVFKEVGATFTLGVFDACFSGSLNLETLRAKGILPTGFNAFETLPQEVLHSEGTMWFASSRPDEVSYEDRELGSVFTHYFMEAMQRADTDGFGVTIDALWEYARSRTQRHTGSAARPQTPQRMVRNLTSSAPLYFSFPMPRSAEISFEPEIEGRFLLRYESGQLTELVGKSSGAPLIVAAYPTQLVLERIDGSTPQSQRLALDPGQRVTVRRRSGWRSPAGLGRVDQRLVTKGGSFDELVLTERVAVWSPLMSASYRVAWAGALAPRSAHQAMVGGRIDRGSGYVQATVGFGTGAVDYEAWGYELKRLDGIVSMGAATDLSGLRLGLGVDVMLSRVWLEYRDGLRRQSGIVGGGPNASVVVPIVDRLHGHVQAGARFERSERVAPIAASPSWELIPWLALGAMVAL